jgi:hypothetical protein
MQRKHAIVLSFLVFCQAIAHPQDITVKFITRDGTYGEPKIEDLFNANVRMLLRKALHPFRFDDQRWMVLGVIKPLGEMVLIDDITLMDLQNNVPTTFDQIELTDIAEPLDTLSPMIAEITAVIKQTQINEKNIIYKLGDSGPGGGVIFSVENDGAYLEASPEPLGKFNYKVAEEKVAQYKGQGNSANWHLPSITELNLLYNYLLTRMPNQLGREIYWSSTAEKGGKSLVMSFANGGQKAFHMTNKFYVFAVRTVGGDAYAELP